MFYGLSSGQVDTGDYVFTHQLVDIETLNRRAFSGELELTAVSLHAYAYLQDKYVLCSCGGSMGDGYGPMVVARAGFDAQRLWRATIAVPGKLTSAYLALRLYLRADFDCLEVPFDEIIPAVVAGEFLGQRIDAGLIIHEGQLTYGDHRLQLVVDLGEWWQDRTGLPLPLGANAIRRDLGTETCREIEGLLKQSIEYGLSHRQEALHYAMRYGRDLDVGQTDRFVGMYVNDWTLDFGPRGRQAVAEFLAQGHELGVLTQLVTPEFIS
jgi:1,4-dihydroxy-6-naphthoate synthase